MKRKRPHFTLLSRRNLLCFGGFATRRWTIVWGIRFMASVIVSAFGLILAAAALLGAGLGSRVGGLGTIVFAFSLLLLLIGSALLIRAKKLAYALVVVLGVILFLACSVMPWYGKHGGKPGTGSHRHSIWELGHVH